LAAQDRAEQKVVKLASQTGEAAQGGGLRPVLNLMDQDVGNKFSGSGFHQTEILWDIPVLSGTAFHECLQIGAALPAKLKSASMLLLGIEGVSVKGRFESLLM
jgi:hypothetical protein